MLSFKIIQGGMGVGVSGWPLARAVSRLGQLGVVSGTGVGAVLVRRLQDGDHYGHVRRAMARFPVPDIAQRVLQRYFIPGGLAADAPYALTPLPNLPLCDALVELTVLGNFVEVYLAKEGHDGAVGINYLEKIQAATLPSLFGAMLAGVDVVLMGAGIPRFIPGALDALARGDVADLRIDVEGALPGDTFVTRFDPAAFFGGKAPALRRPSFLAIVSSATLAQTLARKSNGRVDGFVIEGPTAGGHNAPPRGPMRTNERGEPVYGPRDAVDLERFRELGVPFWMAGGYATRDRLIGALAVGASGIQVGTAFAFCAESGIAPHLKARVLAASRAGKCAVFTDPLASPTGFPFKVLELEGTLSDAAAYEPRTRRCDLGYLRRLYRRDDGSIGYRCPAEAADEYVRKGGNVEQTVGRKCICNALFATIGQGQRMDGGTMEPALVTAGDDVADVARFLRAGQDSYTATDVVSDLLSQTY
jgi:NAD(P)H-dependent flavin oxidoreductase YrpB (nitropropane dioxygenase family)